MQKEIGNSFSGKPISFLCLFRSVYSAAAVPVSAAAVGADSVGAVGDVGIGAGAQQAADGIFRVHRPQRHLDAHLVQFVNETGVFVGGVVLTADPLRHKVQTADVGGQIPLRHQVFVDLVQALARKVCPQHTYLIAHPAGHPAAIFLVCCALRQGSVHGFHVVYAVGQSKILPDDGRRQQHAFQLAVYQCTYPQFGQQLLCLPQQRVVEGNKDHLFYHLGLLQHLQHPGHKVRVVVHGGFQFQMHGASRHLPAQFHGLLQGGDLLVLKDGAFPAAKIQFL